MLLSNSVSMISFGSRRAFTPIHITQRCLTEINVHNSYIIGIIYCDGVGVIDASLVALITSAYISSKALP